MPPVRSRRIAIAGPLTPETTEHEWLRITSLDPKAFPATLVRRPGPFAMGPANFSGNQFLQAVLQYVHKVDVDPISHQGIRIRFANS